MADFNTLDYRVEDGIAIATFNRPDKMNTFSVVMMQDLLDCSIVPTRTTTCAPWC